MRAGAARRFLLDALSVETDACVPWPGPGKTYGQLWIRGKAVPAHRAAWMLARGPIPDGLWILHHCDNPPCVNPKHLFLGTQADNHKDMMLKGRNPHGERHGRAKISDAQVAALRADAARMTKRGSGAVHYQALGLKYGVSGTHAYLIVTGQARLRPNAVENFKPHAFPPGWQAHRKVRSRRRPIRIAESPCNSTS
jgi:hypothetical protein